MQTSLINNLRILRIKNPKFSGYCFYMNTNIYWDFQICIGVPLKKRLWHRCFPVNSAKFLRTPSAFVKDIWRDTILAGHHFCPVCLFLKVNNKFVFFRISHKICWYNYECNRKVLVLQFFCSLILYKTNATKVIFRIM